MWQRLKHKLCCCCCCYCCKRDAANRVHPYTPAMTFREISSVPSVIDLRPGPHSTTGFDRDNSQSLDFSLDNSNGEIELCESTVAAPPMQTMYSPTLSRTGALHSAQALQDNAPSSILQSINRAGLDHTNHEQQQNATQRSRTCELPGKSSPGLDQLVSPNSRVPERVQKGLRRSSMYQDPQYSLHFVVLSTDQFAIRVELDKVTRGQFEALLKLHSDPTDRLAIREACQLCHKLGHAWSSLPRRMEISAGLLHVPIQDLEQRMRDSRNASLMMSRPMPDSPV